MLPSALLKLPIDIAIGCWAKIKGLVIGGGPFPKLFKFDGCCCCCC
jgi:hypothetical protein